MTSLQSALPMAALMGLVACGGGGGSGSTSMPAVPAAVATTAARTAGVSIHILIPGSSPASALHRPAYISPATQSLSFAQQGQVTTTVALTPNSPACAPAAGGGRMCTVNASAAPGTNQTFLVRTFASTDGSGSPLSAQTVVATITQNATNPLNFVLNGVVASISLAFSNASIVYGEPSSTNVVVNALDGSGNTIVGPGVYGDANGAPITIVLANTDPSGNTTLTGSSVTAPGTTVPYAYNGGPIVSAKVTATAAGVPTASATLTFGCRATPATTALYLFSVLGTTGVLSKDVGYARYSGAVNGPLGSNGGFVNTSDTSTNSFAVDNAGYVYSDAGAGGTNNRYITQFCPDSVGAPPPRRSIPLGGPNADAIATDRQRNVYVLRGDTAGRFAFGSGPDLSLQVAEFAPDAGTLGPPAAGAVPIAPIRTIAGTASQMTKPVSLAVDGAGTVYVGNVGQITEYRPASTGSPSGIIVNTAGGLLQPLDTIVGPTGKVYVLYRFDNRSAKDPNAPFGGDVYGGPYGENELGWAVAEYAPGSFTTPARVLGGPATKIGNAQYTLRATALALDPAGNVYVLSQAHTLGAPGANFSVAKFTPSQSGDVAPASYFVVTIPGEDQLEGLAVDGNGNSYITDNSGHGVLVYDSAGTLVHQIPATTAGIGITRGIVSDPAGNIVFESRRYQATNGSINGTNAIFYYPAGADTATAPTKTIATGSGVVIENDFGTIGRLRTDAGGNVYLLNEDYVAFTSGTDVRPVVSVVEYAPNAGANAAPIRTFSDPFASAGLVTGLGIDALGNAYVSSFDSNAVYVYTPTASGSNVSPVNAYIDTTASTLDAAITFGAGLNVYAASCETNSIAIYPPGSSAGAPPQAIIGPHTHLLCPTSIAVAPDGTIYVGNEFAHTVTSYSPGATGDVAPAATVSSLNPGGFSALLAVGPGSVSGSVPAGVRRSTGMNARAARGLHTRKAMHDRTTHRRAPAPASSGRTPVGFPSISSGGAGLLDSPMLAQVTR